MVEILLEHKLQLLKLQLLKAQLHKRLQQLQHGLNIVKMSDGTTRKIMMK